MKKLILLILLVGWILQPLQAQIGPGGGNDGPTMSPQMQFVSKTRVQNTSSQECWRFTFKYKCPAGNCNISVSRDGTIQNLFNSGSPNSSWRNYSGTVCFNRRTSTYSSRVDCRVGYRKDGAVVVIEGGG